MIQKSIQNNICNIVYKCYQLKEDTTKHRACISAPSIMNKLRERGREREREREREGGRERDRQSERGRARERERERER